MNLAAVEIKAFVPARDLAHSLAFYRELGFEVPFSSDELAYVRHGESSFLLQQGTGPRQARNVMMHLLVENVGDWHRHVLASGVAHTPGVHVGALLEQPWRMKEFLLTDPAGVVWRIAQNI